MVLLVSVAGYILLTVGGLCFFNLKQAKHRESGQALASTHAALFLPFCLRQILGIGWLLAYWVLSYFNGVYLIGRSHRSGLKPFECITDELKDQVRYVDSKTKGDKLLTRKYANLREWLVNAQSYSRDRKYASLFWIAVSLSTINLAPFSILMILTTSTWLDTFNCRQYLLAFLYPNLPGDNRFTMHANRNGSFLYYLDGLYCKIKSLLHSVRQYFSSLWQRNDYWAEVYVLTTLFALGYARAREYLLMTDLLQILAIFLGGYLIMPNKSDVCFTTKIKGASKLYVTGVNAVMASALKSCKLLLNLSQVFLHFLFFVLDAICDVLKFLKFDVISGSVLSHSTEWVSLLLMTFLMKSLYFSTPFVLFGTVLSVVEIQFTLACMFLYAVSPVIFSRNFQRILHKLPMLAAYLILPSNFAVALVLMKFLDADLFRSTLRAVCCYIVSVEPKDWLLYQYVFQGYSENNGVSNFFLKICQCVYAKALRFLRHDVVSLSGKSEAHLLGKKEDSFANRWGRYCASAGVNRAIEAVYPVDTDAGTKGRIYSKVKIARKDESDYETRVRYIFAQAAATSPTTRFATVCPNRQLPSFPLEHAAQYKLYLTGDAQDSSYDPPFIINNTDHISSKGTIKIGCTDMDGAFAVFCADSAIMRGLRSRVRVLNEVLPPQYLSIDPSKHNANAMKNGIVQHVASILKHDGTEIYSDYELDLPASWQNYQQQLCFFGASLQGNYSEALKEKWRLVVVDTLYELIACESKEDLRIFFEYSDVKMSQAILKHLGLPSLIYRKISQVFLQSQSHTKEVHASLDRFFIPSSVTNDIISLAKDSVLFDYWRMLEKEDREIITRRVLGTDEHGADDIANVGHYLISLPMIFSHVCSEDMLDISWPEVVRSFTCDSAKESWFDFGAIMKSPAHKKQGGKILNAPFFEEMSAVFADQGIDITGPDGGRHLLSILMKQFDVEHSLLMVLAVVNHLKKNRTGPLDWHNIDQLLHNKPLENVALKAELENLVITFYKNPAGSHMGLQAVLKRDIFNSFFYDAPQEQIGARARVLSYCKERPSAHPCHRFLLLMLALNAYYESKGSSLEVDFVKKVSSLVPSSKDHDKKAYLEFKKKFAEVQQNYSSDDFILSSGSLANPNIRQLIPRLVVLMKIHVLPNDAVRKMFSKIIPEWSFDCDFAYMKTFLEESISYSFTQDPLDSVSNIHSKILYQKMFLPSFTFMLEKNGFITRDGRMPVRNHIPNKNFKSTKKPSSFFCYRLLKSLFNMLFSFVFIELACMISFPLLYIAFRLIRNSNARLKKLFVLDKSWSLFKHNVKNLFMLLRDIIRHPMDFIAELFSVGYACLWHASSISKAMLKFAARTLVTVFCEPFVMLYRAGSALCRRLNLYFLRARSFFVHTKYQSALKACSLQNTTPPTKATMKPCDPQSYLSSAISP